MTNKFCVAFVCNFRYLNKFYDTCNALINVGEYTGPIVLLVGSDINVKELRKQHFFSKYPQILIHQEPDLTFSNATIDLINTANAKCDKFGYKLFQYHKFYLFTPFFKQWSYVFYIDCGAKIYDNIAPILAQATPNTLVAHSDAYPTYKWKLKDQFIGSIPEALQNLDYFQSTIMLYSTNLIDGDNTLHSLCNLVEKYPHSKTNDQGIINLQFIHVWKQIDICDNKKYLYDFNVRHTDKPYIMTKYFVFND